MELKERLWEIVKDTPELTYYDFLCNLEGWTLDGVYDGDALAFVVITKGPEFHFVSCGTKLKVNRAILAKYPGSLIDRYGFAETSTPKTPEYTRQHRFNKLIGFVPTHETDTHVFYRIERIKCLPFPS